MKLFKKFRKPYGAEDTNYVCLYNICEEFLTERVIRLFKFSGEQCPSSHHIEERLLLSGASYIAPYKEEYVAFFGQLNGVTVYYDEFTHVNVYSPVYAKRLKLFKEVAPIYNNSLKQGCWKLIHLYASLLAHSLVTYLNVCINLRANNVMISSTNKQYTAIQQYRNDLCLGKVQPVMDNTWTGIEVTPLPQYNRDLIECYDVTMEILNDFYSHFGIKTVYRKKGNLIESEVEGDDEKLMINIGDMLASREEGCDNVYKTFGLKWKVERVVNDAEVDVRSTVDKLFSRQSDNDVVSE